MKIHKIKDSIYYSDIYVINQATPKGLANFFKRKYGHPYQHNNFFPACHYLLSSESTGIVAHFLIFNNFENTPSGLGLFNHELTHLVFSVLNLVGMKYSEDSEEAYAYYTSHLTEKILEKLC